MKVLTFLLPVLLLAACSKKGNNDNQNNNGSPIGITLVAGTLSHIPVIDEGTKFRYLQSVTGIAVYRSQTSKPYDFTQLAQDKDCKWKLEYAGSISYAAGTGPSSLDGQVVAFRNNKKLTEWWGVGTTADPYGNPQYFLSLVDYNTKPNPIPDQVKFKLHYVGEQNGVDAYFIESVLYPGYYLCNEGHTLTANGVILKNTASSKAIIEFH